MLGLAINGLVGTTQMFISCFEIWSLRIGGDMFRSSQNVIIDFLLLESQSICSCILLRF